MRMLEWINYVPTTQLFHSYAPVEVPDDIILQDIKIFFDERITSILENLCGICLQWAKDDNGGSHHWNGSPTFNRNDGIK